RKGSCETEAEGSSISRTTSSSWFTPQSKTFQPHPTKTTPTQAQGQWTNGPEPMWLSIPLSNTTYIEDLRTARYGRRTRADPCPSFARHAIEGPSKGIGGAERDPSPASRR